MVLAPSQDLNIFASESLPSEHDGFLKIDNLKDELKSISQSSLDCSLVVNDSNENVLKRNRYHSIDCLSTVTNTLPSTSYKRQLSSDSAPRHTENEQNNNFKESSVTSKSLSNLYWKKVPPKVPAKPLKRRLTNLFLFKSHETNATHAPTITVEDTTSSDSNTHSSPELPRSKTPSLFRKLNRSPSPSSMTIKSSSLPTNSHTNFLKFHHSHHVHQHQHINNKNGTTNHIQDEMKKQRSFSLRTDEPLLRLPAQKGFPSLRRSPFMRSKFDHNSSDNEMMRRNIYNEMLNSIQINDCKRLKLLLKRRKTEVNLVKENTLPLIHEAAFKGCVKCTKALIKTGWSLNLSDHLSWKPLHTAVFGGSLETVRLLLGHGANIDDVTPDGLTALHIAIHKGDLNLVHELFTHGSNPLLNTNYPVTPFQLSINMKKSLIIDYFCAQSCFLVDNH